MVVVWTKEQMVKLLQSNSQAVLRAIVVLYNRQTELEKEFKESNVVNGIGFNCKDSWYLSNLARQLIQFKKISKDDFWRARWRIQKYAQQLADIANENENKKRQYIKQIRDILIKVVDNKCLDKKC